MIITANNIKVPDGIVGKVCDVISHTVILPPSEVPKYLGSYEKHKLLNKGIFKNDKVEVLNIETDSSGIIWCLINHAGLYYYTPAQYINTDGFNEYKKAHKELSQIAVTNNSRLLRVARATPGTAMKALCQSNGTNILYTDTSTNASKGTTISNGQYFTILSKVLNEDTKKYWYATADFTPRGSGILYYIPAENVTAVNKSETYVMITKDTAFKKCNTGEGVDLLKKGATVAVLFDYNSSNYGCIYGTAGDCFSVYLPKADASPKAQSSDILMPDNGDTIRLYNARAVRLERATYNDAMSHIDEVEGSSNRISGTYSISLSFNASGRVYYIVYKSGDASYYLVNDTSEGTYTQGSIVDGTPTGISGNANPVGSGSSGMLKPPAPTITPNPVIKNEKVVSTTGSKRDGTETRNIELSTGEEEDWKYKYPDPEDQLPGDYEDDGTLDAMMRYELQSNPVNDIRQFRKINRFKLSMPDAAGLTTRSFIFMTRPDLNLFSETENEIGSTSVDTDNMNPDLERLPTFKYIWDMPFGKEIFSSLETWGTIHTAVDIDSPWLSIFSNCARGYDVTERKIDIFEMGETFHGNKIIYAEPTFKHKIAGTVNIPFIERRDMSLYYTLKTWIDYIQNVSIGKISPRHTHIINAELDYGVSLYFITTDETMENILYWEKLTGVIPLTVPDDFWSWDESSNARRMNYNIEFAYSLRSIQEPSNLQEINYLYIRSQSATDALPVSYYSSDSYAYNFDYNLNEHIANLAQFYKRIGSGDKAKTSLVLSRDDINKYYYDVVDTYKENESVKLKVLPNYVPELQTHGIPYVKGPYISYTNRPNERNKYKLRWV